MIADTYQTIETPAEGIFKDRGSKFYSFAYPVDTEEEIKEILANLKKEHFSARHICFAWCLGLNQASYRINDDGEPSGTAGRPIFGQIQSKGLTNILIVVVRYFGGTLLGVSGLIQAYRSAAQDVLSNSVILTKTKEITLEIVFDYLVMNDLMSLMKEERLEIVRSQFDVNCQLLTHIPLSRVDTIKAKIAKISGVISYQTIN